MKKILLTIFNRLKLNILFDDFNNIFKTPKLLYHQIDYDKYWETEKLKIIFNTDGQLWQLKFLIIPAF